VFVDALTTGTKTALAATGILSLALTGNAQVFLSEPPGTVTAFEIQKDVFNFFHCIDVQDRTAPRRLLTEEDVVDCVSETYPETARVKLDIDTQSGFVISFLFIVS